MSLPYSFANGSTKGSVIYDFGMNNGDDIEYYLRKGFQVVGVDANPNLCQACERRFSRQIANGRLTIVNAALTSEPSSDDVTFWLHKELHVLSQFPQPEPERLCEFEPIRVPQTRASDLVKSIGKPHYIKIDVEHLDGAVLCDLFANGIVPPFISAEVHHIEVFCRIVAAGYPALNLVRGKHVAVDYRDATILTPQGSIRHSFPPHSAGPYGVDLQTPWRTPDSMFELLAREGLGWLDLHASTELQPTTSEWALLQGARPITPRSLFSRARAVAKRSFRREVARRLMQPTKRLLGRRQDSDSRG